VSLAEEIHVVVRDGEPVLAFFNPLPADDYQKVLRDQGHTDVEVVVIPLAHAHPIMADHPDVVDAYQRGWEDGAAGNVQHAGHGHGE